MPEQKQSFLHDADSHRDERMLELISKHGWQGYGLFWALIELMRGVSELRLCMNRIGAISFGLHAEEQVIRSLVATCIEVGLFEEKAGHFSSPALRRRIEAFEQARLSRNERAKSAASKRWESRTSPEPDSDAQAMLKHSASNAEAMPEQCSVNTNTNLNPNQSVGVDEVQEKKGLVKVEKVELAPRIVVTAAEATALCDEFGSEAVQRATQTASDWLLAEGKTKKNYAAFMRNWLRREQATGRPAEKAQFKNSRERNEEREVLAVQRLRMVEESGAKSLFHIGLDAPKLVEVKKK